MMLRTSFDWRSFCPVVNIRRHIWRSFQCDMSTFNVKTCVHAYEKQSLTIETVESSNCSTVLDSL